MIDIDYFYIIISKGNLLVISELSICTFAFVTIIDSDNDNYDNSKDGNIIRFFSTIKEDSHYAYLLLEVQRIMHFH